MCSLRFENSFLTIGHVRFRFVKTVVLLSNMFASLRKWFLFYLMCLLRFENNLLTIEGVRFTSILKKKPLSKLSFALISLGLPLLLWRQKVRRLNMNWEQLPSDWPMRRMPLQTSADSGRSVRNSSWPYFERTFKEYPTFRRKFRSY